MTNGGFGWSVFRGFGFSGGVEQNKKKPKLSLLTRNKKKSMV